MQIILMYPRRLQDRQVTLTSRHLAAALLAVLALTLVAAFMLSAMMLRFGDDIQIPFLQQAISSVKHGDGIGRPRPVREDVALMMLKLGDMEARMMRLDSLGERVQHLAGVSPEAFNFNEIPGRGGYYRDYLGRYDGRGTSLSELSQTLDALAVDLEHRADYLSAVEAALLDRNGMPEQLSIRHPISGAINSSPFGLRVDPFTGHAAFHEGLDFAAPVGTPILAAADGVVVAAVQHEQYGNMVDISHGNDIVTRYAHASRLRVRRGDLIRRGQHIADVGSTGRSTGAHLHFEVQVGGLAQNPATFLANSEKVIKMADKGSD